MTQKIFTISFHQCELALTSRSRLRATSNRWYDVLFSSSYYFNTIKLCSNWAKTNTTAKPIKGCVHKDGCEISVINCEATFLVSQVLEIIFCTYLALFSVHFIVTKGSPWVHCRIMWTVQTHDILYDWYSIVLSMRWSYYIVFRLNFIVGYSCTFILDNRLQFSWYWIK